uniref:Uncharacterized protein n=1 Tax=Zea mays TaxID=4577 RepID=A0A804QRA4_MAIZE
MQIQTIERLKLQNDASHRCHRGGIGLVGNGGHGHSVHLDKDEVQIKGRSPPCRHGRRRVVRRDDPRHRGVAAELQVPGAARGDGRVQPDEQARAGRLRLRVQGRAGGRAGGGGEAALLQHAAVGGAVLQRGEAGEPGAAQEPGQAAGLQRGGAREPARLRVPLQHQPRPLPLRRVQEERAGLGAEVRDRAGHGGGPLLPAQRLGGPDHTPRHQGQQRPAGRQVQAEDRRLRPRQELHGRPEPPQHRPRRNFWVHGSGVHRPRAAHREGRHLQLRRAGPRDRHRPEEPQLGGVICRRPLTHGTDMETLHRGHPDGAAGPEPPRAVLGGGRPPGVPRRPAVRPGVAEPSAAHVEGGGDAERQGSQGGGASPAHPASLHQRQGVQRQERQLRRVGVQLRQVALLAEPAVSQWGAGQVKAS